MNSPSSIAPMSSTTASGISDPELIRKSVSTRPSCAHTVHFAVERKADAHKGCVSIFPCIVEAGADCGDLSPGRYGGQCPHQGADHPLCRFTVLVEKEHMRKASLARPRNTTIEGGGKTDIPVLFQYDEAIAFGLRAKPVERGVRSAVVDNDQCIDLRRGSSDQPA